MECFYQNGGGYQGEKNIWNAVLKYEIEIRMTQYPIPLAMEKIVDVAKSYGVPVTFDPPELKKEGRLWVFSEIGALGYSCLLYTSIYMQHL